MVDFIEFNLRKVATSSSIFCSDKCNLFSNIMDEDLSNKEQRLQLSCFEKCLGKHTDGLELALGSLTEHLKQTRERETAKTKRDGFLLG